MDILLSAEEIEEFWKQDIEETQGEYERRLITAQHQKDVDWGDEECSEHGLWEGCPTIPRRKCDECWKAFVQVGKE